MKSLLRTKNFINQYPVAGRHRLQAYRRVLGWQMRASREDATIWPWIGNTKRGVTGAKGNIYTGLAELNDMAFVLHFCRPDFSFLDVGANVPAYTVLASGVCGARSHVFESVPATLAKLRWPGSCIRARLTFPLDVGGTLGSVLPMLFGRARGGGTVRDVRVLRLRFGRGDGRGGRQIGAMRGSPSGSRRIRGAAGQALGRCSVVRVFMSSPRAAIFTMRRRSVSNLAGRHGKRFGRAARRVHIS